MGRKGDFSEKTKQATIERQGGVCAFCGVTLKTPWSEGEHEGCAHHLRPLVHGGSDSLDNCVYLCWGHHQLIGHGMAPFGIDKQGGSSDSWVQLSPDDFEFWNLDSD
jgi:predicted restriction endonuclease